MGPALGTSSVLQSFSIDNGSNSGHIDSKLSCSCNIEVFDFESCLVHVDLESSTFTLFSKESREYIRSFVKPNKQNHKIATICMSHDDSMLFFAYENDSKLYSVFVSLSSNVFSPSLHIEAGFSSIEKWKGSISELYCFPKRSLLLVVSTGGHVQGWNYSGLKKRLRSNDSNRGDNENDDDVSETMSVVSGASSSQVRGSNRNSINIQRSSKYSDIVPKYLFVCDPSKPLTAGFEIGTHVTVDPTGNLIAISWSHQMIGVYSVDKEATEMNTNLGGIGIIKPLYLRKFDSLNAISLDWCSPIRKSGGNVKSSVFFSEAMTCHSICFHSSQPQLYVLLEVPNLLNKESSFCVIIYSLLHLSLPILGLEDLSNHLQFFCDQKSRRLKTRDPSLSIDPDTIINFTFPQSKSYFVVDRISSTNGCDCWLHVVTAQGYYALSCSLVEDFRDQFFVKDMACSRARIPCDVFWKGKEALVKELVDKFDDKKIDAKLKEQHVWPSVLCLKPSFSFRTGKLEAICSLVS